MADPMSIIGGISAVGNLADAGCSLAGSLYKTFRAIKDAPRAVQRLSKELGKFHDLLQDVDNLLQRYSTSLVVTEDGLSVDSVQSVLQECQRELESVQKTAATFETQPSKLKNTTARFRWVVDERKIKQHCQTIEQLRQHVNTGLSVLSHQYDIKARERDKSLHSQVTEVRSVLDTSATETRDLVSSEFGTVRSDIKQVAANVAIGQEGLQQYIQTSHDHLYGEVSNARIQTSHGIESIQNDLRDVNLLVQHDQQHAMQEILQLNQSIKNIDSMLSQVLSFYSEREESLPNCSLAQHSRLEGLMLSLLMMKSSLVSALSELKSKSSLDISEEEIEFLLSEFENLVAFSHEASAVRIRQRCIRPEGEDRPSRGCIDHTSMTRNYALDVDSFSQPSVTRRERLRTSSYADASGRLKLSFEDRAGDVNGRPASVLNATFSYVPNRDFYKIGLYATFRKEIRRGLNPSVKRSLRVIRVFDYGDSTYCQLLKVLQEDDLHGLHRMLSCGQIRPWDQNWGGWNLLSMALYWGSYIGKIVQYLLVDAWDIENSYSLHTLFWYKPWEYDPGGSRDLDSFFRFSRRIAALGQAIQADDIHNYVQSEPFGRISYLTSEAPNYREHFKFLISQGADVEYRAPNSRETALLVAAEGDENTSLKWMQELLWLDADYSAVDYKGRGPLHLTLKPCRIYTRADEGLRYYRAIKAKLVHLLQAGCSIHAVDNDGRTPTDVARRWKRTKAWEAALKEVGKLECARWQCQCEVVKTDISESCNATSSALGHEHEENEYEDSDVDSSNEVDFGTNYSEDDGGFCFEDSEESGLDGDELEEPWMPEDEDEDQSQDFDLYEADSEGHDTDTDSVEEDHQITNPRGDQHETSNQKPDKENLEESPPDEKNLHNHPATLPQVPESNPSPTPELHHDTIALGQHHLWMM